jgi:hypothetical protein
MSATKSLFPNNCRIHQSEAYDSRFSGSTAANRLLLLELAAVVNFKYDVGGHCVMHNGVTAVAAANVYSISIINAHGIMCQLRWILCWVAYFIF